MAVAIGFDAEVLNVANGTEWTELARTARCSRCDGFLVIVQDFDLLDNNGRQDFVARRCVQCGELVDPVILRNRQLLRQGNRGNNERGSKSFKC